MTGSNAAQIDYWNGRAGEKWAELQVHVDAMLSPCTAELKARAQPVAGRRVLDIGCGTGETCAIWLDGGATVTGLDVSGPMLAVAAARTGSKATLVKADASVWIADAPFDLAVSRFGVMFFEDPGAAFANIAANLRPAGRLVFACWRPVEENPWVTTPMSAIRDLLPEAPPPAPHEPGPFALADKDRLTGILRRAGFADVAIDPFDFPVNLASEGGVETAVRFLTQIGPAGRALSEASTETRSIALKRLRVALAPHEKDGRVTMAGATWMEETVRPG